MKAQRHLREALIQEIACYLAAVDLFRAERCEPTWRAESTTRPIAHEHLQACGESAPSAH